MKTTFDFKQEAALGSAIIDSHTIGTCLQFFISRVICRQCLYIAFSGFWREATGRERFSTVRSEGGEWVVFFFF